MRAQHALQCRVQKMGGGMVGAGGAAALMIHRKVDRLAHGHIAAFDFYHVNMQGAEFLFGVEHDGFRAIGAGDGAVVADLAAGFAIEWRLVGQYTDGFAHLRTIHPRAVAHDGRDGAFGTFGVVAKKLARAQFIAQGEPEGVIGRFAGAGPGFARLRPLFLHRGFKARGVNRNAARLQRILRQVEREAIRVIEFEGDIARQHGPFGKRASCLIQQLQTAGQRVAETGFFQLQGFGDQRLRADQFGIGGAHFGRQRRHQPVHQRFLGTDQMSMAHGAAHDPAQDIATAFVRWQHAIGNQERGRAQMIGDHAMAGGRIAPGRNARCRHRCRDQMLKQIGVEHIVHALHHGGEAFEAHAGVDGGAGKVLPPAIGELLVLHEDEVPDLDKAVAVFIRAAGRAAGDGWAVVVEDFGARAAGAGIAHRPEIVRGGDTDDTLVWQARDLLPQSCGLIILGIDGDEKTVLGKCEILRQQRPGELDRIVLEIIAEREIAQHFEKGQVAGGVADIVEVIVLAAGANAFLGRGGAGIGPLLLPGEGVLELHHPGIGEEQGGVVARHQRGGGHNGVAMAAEEAKEMRTDVGQACHGLYVAGGRFLVTVPCTGRKTGYQKAGHPKTGHPKPEEGHPCSGCPSGSRSPCQQGTKNSVFGSGLRRFLLAMLQRLADQARVLAHLGFDLGGDVRILG